MPIVVSGIRIGLDQTEEQAIRKAIKKLKHRSRSKYLKDFLGK